MMPFEALFFALRKGGLTLGLGDWMSVVDALSKEIIAPTLDDFYFVTRALVCKSENQYDIYDQVFSEVMQGVSSVRNELERFLDWLQDPKSKRFLDTQGMTPQSLQDLLKGLEERLKNQKERHDGGVRALGTGGGSPFGNGGVNPAGIRVGGGGGKSAVQIAAERRFKDYRDDVVLDERGMSVALKGLRKLSRKDDPLELDLEESVDKTCKNAGELELAFIPPRKNQSRVLLMLDTGGSMDPFADMVEQLFTAATKLNHWKKFAAFAFHNCVYEKVYTRIATDKGQATAGLIADHPADTFLIMVGDAYMAPYELSERHGAISLSHENNTPGIVWLHRLRSHFKNAVWMNPMPERVWENSWTIKTISEIVPMFPLSLRGLDDAIKHLTRGQPPPLPALDPRYEYR